ncbi:hypothetical protein HKX48_000568 [Thoreauomyces humboldtii]|nr:hypothetical protein HKX48_000568 [Thoreauomyces humboldtii]
MTSERQRHRNDPYDCPFFDWHDLQGYGKDYEWFLTGGCTRNDVRFGVGMFNIVAGLVLTVAAIACVFFGVRRDGRGYWRTINGTVVQLSGGAVAFNALYGANTVFLPRLYYLERLGWIAISELAFSCQSLVAYTWMRVSGPMVSNRLAEDAAKIRGRLKYSLVLGRILAVGGTLISGGVTAYFQALMDRDSATIAWACQLAVTSADCGWVAFLFWKHGGALVSGIRTSCRELRQGCSTSMGVEDLLDVAVKVNRFRILVCLNALSLLLAMIAGLTWGLATYTSSRGAVGIGYLTLVFGPPVNVIFAATIWVFGVQPLLRDNRQDDERTMVADPEWETDEEFLDGVGGGSGTGGGGAMPLTCLAGMTTGKGKRFHDVDLEGASGPRSLPPHRQIP